MATKRIQSETLASIANAIRSKTGKTDAIEVSNMASEIASISAGAKVYTLTRKSSSSNTIVFECEKRPVLVIIYNSSATLTSGKLTCVAFVASTLAYTKVIEMTYTSKTSYCTLGYNLAEKTLSITSSNATLNTSHVCRVAY